MIDINRIRQNPEEIEKAINKRMIDISLKNVIKKDQEKRKTGTELDEMRAKRNKVSDSIPKLKKEGQDISNLIIEMRELGEKIEQQKENYNKLDEEISTFLKGLPNIPDEDVIAGGKEKNKVIKTYLEKPIIDFKLKTHDQVCRDLNLIDFERGIKLSGEKSWIYKGLGARLEWALINYFIDEHIKDNYEFLMLPYLLNYNCGYGAGQFPKFNDEVYWLKNEEETNNKFLLPTAETALVNVHSNEILNFKDLPKKYFSYTQCFRVEAGSSRSEERGIIRGHQFNKVEMVQYVTKENTEVAFNELLNKAEKLVQGLGLHYQVSKLAAGDCSASMCKTYDIEVWIPSMGIYKEVSSVSSSRDYQARRNNTKYYDLDGNIQYVCTLNGSGLATSRIIPAILEQYQNKDGSITIPKVLVPYMGVEIIK